jgi:hypothetical protein
MPPKVDGRDGETCVREMLNNKPIWCSGRNIFLFEDYLIVTQVQN